jgi:hypothetical protein
MSIYDHYQLSAPAAFATSSGDISC